MDKPTKQPDYRGFALGLFELTDWPMDAGDIDGCDFQETALRHGLLFTEKRVAPCGEDCGCADYTDGEVNCYLKHPDLLSGPTDASLSSSLARYREALGDLATVAQAMVEYHDENKRAAGDDVRVVRAEIAKARALLAEGEK